MELFSSEWFAAFVAIVVVDLLLAGDNAVVIALAARNLPERLKRRAVIWGTLGAVIIRVILVFFVSQLLLLPFVGMVGGAVLYIIAWRLMGDAGGGESTRKPANDFWAAMATIIVADTAMGLDNILAIAGAARGDMTLIIFGLGLSIPIMMGGSMLILKAMQKAPWLIIIGAALLSGIAGRIILDDKWLQEQLELSVQVEWLLILAAAAVVTGASLLWYRRRERT